MVSRGTAYDYWHAPCVAAMKVDEGTWTSMTEHKYGGYFATPVHNGVWVKLSTDWTVAKATAPTDTVIGQLMSEPQGEQIASTRQASVLLLGEYIKEVEMHTSSPAVGVGSSIQFSASGGYFGEGVWQLDTVSNTTLALASYTSGSATGSTIPVLFGYRAF